ncbi:MAG: hypothetical protein FWD90_01345 [Defluviitaleaceae bacterium]|nr:hypothetical protein [Defluviitaleaceae bacterium]
MKMGSGEVIILSSLIVRDVKDYITRNSEAYAAYVAGEDEKSNNFQKTVFTVQKTYTIKEAEKNACFQV